MTGREGRQGVNEQRRQKGCEQVRKRGIGGGGVLNNMILIRDRFLLHSFRFSYTVYILYLFTI